MAAQKQDEEVALKASRKARLAHQYSPEAKALNAVCRITEKLQELGYGEDEFPSTKDWSKLVDQPKELTDRSAYSSTVSIMHH